jgi:superfamily II DNA or RNA helicase
MPSPGFSIKRLLQELPLEVFVSLIPENVKSVLSAGKIILDNSQGSRKNLIKQLDLIEILSSDHLVKLLNFLAKSKRQELLSLHNLPLDFSVEQLAYECGKKKNFNKTLSFFGLFPPTIFNKPAIMSDIDIQVSYGLFKHQFDVVAKVNAELNRNPKCVLLHMPTGSGKTRTAMHIICQHLISNQSTVVWLAHNRELLEQASLEFSKAWSSLGNRKVQLCRYWGHHNGDIHSVHDGIIVAGLQKLYNFNLHNLPHFLALADKASLTIIDEAHISIAPTFQEAIKLLWQKKPHNKLLGLSATPGRTWADRDEDRKLSALFSQKKVTLEIEGYEDPVTYLIDEGYLASPKFYYITASPVNMSQEEIHEVNNSVEISDEILDRIGEDTARNIQIINLADQLLRKHQRIIIFAPSVKSARLITAGLSTKKCISLCITGDMDTNTRERAISEFKSDRNEPMALCNYGVLTTGFDAPKTSAAIIARPTRSLVLYSQMVGRATRGIRAGGNKEAEILTVVDPELPGFGQMQEAFSNWEDVWNESSS